jgi:hypothetical protein
MRFWLLFLLLGLSGCSTTNISKLAQSLAKDDATVVVKVGSVYGTGFFVRTNPRTNQTVVVSPDGTVSIGTK